jgi:alcohol dehydrogenase (cytochrome c)
VAAGAALGAFLAQNMHGFEVEQRPTLQESEWPTYNNGYEGRRFSLLRDITARNVGSLREVCRLQLAEGGSFHTGPVVVDRAMYLTTALDTFSIDPTDCSVRWRSTYELEQSSVWPANRGVAVNHAAAPIVAGVTPTAGGIVLTGDMAGNFLALDSRIGTLLYKKQTGGAVAGGVVTYAVEGRQYIAFTSGNVSRSTFGAVGVPTLVILSLSEQR